MTDNGYQILKQMKQVKIEHEIKRKNKYKQDSKKRLKKIAGKKIQTTMIGALDVIERHLGFLWENDDEDSLELRQIYSDIRQEILDRGNKQIRNLESEIDQYDVEWLRYNLKLPVKRRMENNG